LAAGGSGWLAHLPPVSATEARLPGNVVPLGPEIEPLVRLLEETPRERLLEAVAARVRQGLKYKDLLAALQLAGVRNVQPRPSVGFKFHAVLVVNSVHLASMAVADRERWIPLFWALDYFKDSQARDVREGDWTMGRVDEAAVPGAEEARRAFVRAMDHWDVAAADAAIAGLARTAAWNEIFELFYRYGARDYRSIGHKAIFVANGERTLRYIGQGYAEPVLRSLAYALLMHEDGNPAERDAPADRSWRDNQQLAVTIRTEWRAGEVKPEATRDMLAVLRNGDPADAARAVVRKLNAAVSPQSIWDAVFVGAGELLLRQPGIVALHAVTTSNALHFAYQATRDDLTRRLLLLQNAALLPQFRQSMQGRGHVGEMSVDELEPLDPEQRGPGAVAEILADVGRDRRKAARKTLAYLRAGGDAAALVKAARKVLIYKGDDAHDYKFGSAVMEDYRHLSPEFESYFLASSMMWLCGSTDRDNPLVGRSAAAFG
jgi:hypothetical protein